MYWMLLPLKRYADFNGRSWRKEFWMFTLAQLLVACVLCIPIFLDVAMLSYACFGFVSYVSFGLLVLVGLGLIVPNIALIVRRFHDLGKSGWFYFLNFIPYVGGLIVIVFMCFDAVAGENAYGADPKQLNTP